MSTLVGTSLCVVPSSVGCLWVFHFLCPQRIFLVIANEGQRIDIPDGCILENRTFGFRSISCLLTLITPIFRFTFGKPKYDCPFNLYSRIYHLLIAFSLGAVVPSFSFVVDVSSCESNLIKIAFYLSCAISCNLDRDLSNKLPPTCLFWSWYLSYYLSHFFFSKMMLLGSHPHSTKRSKLLTNNSNLLWACSTILWHDWQRELCLIDWTRSFIKHPGSTALPRALFFGLAHSE